MRWFLLFMILMPIPGHALEVCDDLWFTRNLVYHRAGTCFTSALGKAVFGNEGCVRGAVHLDQKAGRLVGRVRAMETTENCNVDTTRTSLKIPEMELRGSLVDLPVATGSETSCSGWSGGRLPLHSERRVDAVLTGAARNGDTLLFEFADVDGWSFVELLQNGVPAGAGWARIEINEGRCAVLAG